MIRYASSYRDWPLRESLDRVKPFAAALGITRVTDITRLDRIGVPVFSSVRPGAASGSLCVNAGKGLTRAEARVGAYMEAVEFACAEQPRSEVKIELASARHVLDGERRSDAILDLCPLLHARISLDRPLPCVAAEDLDGHRTLVPAELVLHPFRAGPDAAHFGSTTNGLAAGSTLDEATVHALFEVLERDIASFDWLGRESQLVRLETLPAKHRAIIELMRERRFGLAIRWLPNGFGVACFQALVWERDAPEPLFINDGHGCHFDPEVALTRALTEAVQSRLTLIHGARDDIAQSRRGLDGMRKRERRLHARRVLARCSRSRVAFDFRSAKNAAADAATLQDVLARIRRALSQSGMPTILRVPLSGLRDPVHVVRVIVPLLEFFTPEVPRFGRRLSAFARRSGRRHGTREAGKHA